MTLTYEQYKNNLEKICENIAYLAFTEEAFDVLESRDLNESHIKNFRVTIFFTESINEEDADNPFTDVIIRFTVFLNTPDNQEVTQQYYNNEILDALIQKVYKREFSNGNMQHFNFSYGKPNTMQLYDAAFVLEQYIGEF